jgi:pentatricopeptide repeat protein
MKACYNSNQFDEVIMLLEESIEKLSTLPRRALYVLGLRSCGKLRRSDLAVKYLEEMKKQGMDPSQHEYDIVISIYSYQGHLDKVVDLVEEMDTRLITRSSSTYDSLIRAYVRAELWERALLTWNEMKKQEFPLVDISTYRNVMSAYSNAGEYTEAIDLVPSAFGCDMEWRFKETTCEVSYLDSSQACPLLLYYLLHHFHTENFDERNKTVSVVFARKSDHHVNEQDISSLHSSVVTFLSDNGGPPVISKTPYYLRIHKDHILKWLNSENAKVFRKS